MMVPVDGVTSKVDCEAFLGVTQAYMYPLQRGQSFLPVTAEFTVQATISLHQSKSTLIRAL